MDRSQSIGMAHVNSHATAHSEKPYLGLFVTNMIHFAFMYFVMFTMVNTFGDVFLNLNNFYMTGMMLAPMTSLMVLGMGKMYPNKRTNLLIIVGSVGLFVLLFGFMRYQSFIGDKEFVRSMIPHHSGAILMCREAKIRDAELKTLCAQIIESQKQEVDQMKKILSRL